MTATKNELIFALPSKERLHDEAVDFLGQCGFKIRKSSDQREYSAKLSGIANVSINYYRPGEIPARIETGDAHIGITGEDLYREYSENQTASHLLKPNLGFGGARLVVGVPQSWIDVTSIEDLDEAAVLFRQKHGRSLRVATKFMRLARAFFSDQGIVEYSLVESLGATEGAPKAGFADLIVDLTSTGATMTQNHLKEIDGGTVLQSECCLIASLHENIWSKTTLDALEQIIEQMEARMRATGLLTLRFSVPADRAAKIGKALRDSHKCTPISSRAHEDAAPRPASQRDDLVVLCPKASVYGVVKYLRASGAGEVIVDRSEFVYQSPPPSIEGFKGLLKRHDIDTSRA
jgi:ATP phosphoribosyltransferase